MIQALNISKKNSETPFDIPSDQKSNNDEIEEDIFIDRFKPRAILDFFVISRSNKAYHYFTFLMTLVCIIGSIIYAYYTAFRYDVEVSRNADPESEEYKYA